MPEVHPAAAVWPMLPDDELAALADSIRQLGLLDPLVQTPDGLLLEGRNRWAACQLAGVEPTWTTYDGDPAAYVIARNATRRHMTTGARAAAVALVLGPGQRENGHWSRGAVPVTDTGNSSTWRNAVSQAGQVLDHTPGLLPLVASGGMKLAEALRDATTAAQRADNDDDRWAALAESAPDLAAQVREETLTLAEAEAAARQRASDRERAIREGRAAAHTLATDFTAAVLAVVGGIEAEATDPVRVPDSDIEQVQKALALLIAAQQEDPA